MKIKVCLKYVCIKDVKRGKHNRVFTKGIIYNSEQDNMLTNRNGDSYSIDDKCKKYFVKLK